MGVVTFGTLWNATTHFRYPHPVDAKAKNGKPPRRDDVLKARGYSMRRTAGSDDYRTIEATGPVTYAILTVLKGEVPRTAERMTEVLDFLDGFKPKPADALKE